jgi:uncharacterized membrane protein
MTNAWDYPIYLLLAAVAVVFFKKQKHSWRQTITQGLPIGLILLATSVFLSLPFFLHFQNITKGVSQVDFRSPLWMLLVLWGFGLLSTVIFLVFLLTNKKKIKATDWFLLALLVVAWFLILVPEFFYLKDIYIHSHHRANTMFKLTYQAFMIFALANTYIFLRLLTSLKSSLAKILLFLVFAPALLSVTVYPFFAIRSYYNSLRDYQGLDGLAYLKASYPDDYQAVLWLRKNIPDQPNIVEAVGESYTDYARVSANTGLPAVLGWRVHEWLWRGSFDEAGKRTGEVAKIYESPSLEETKTFLNQYRVKYIFWGALEKEKYPQADLEKWSTLAEPVFSSNETTIYRVTD